MSTPSQAHDQGAGRSPSNDAREGAQDTGRRETITPPVDILEDVHGVTLRADLPGVPRDRLNVQVHDNRLVIEAEALITVAPGLRVQYAEVREPRFARSFVLSPDLDASRIDASLAQGVLTLTIPRREEARPRRIKVRAA